jgi:tetratricopeptide (TPR) repeat protein
MTWRPPGIVVTIVTTLVLSSVSALYPPSLSTVHAQTSEELRRQALELAYNLDHDQALELLRRAVRLSPEDAAPHRSLASVLWLNLLFRRGAVTVDHYLGSFSRSSVELAKPPADIDREFRLHIEQAIAIAERRVRTNPRDAQAHYDLGAALGLQASYVATVEGKLLAGFRGARRAYDEHEKVLALDSSRLDAGLIVGTYRYLVSTLSLPMRMLAYVAGFGGGRERGIQMLEKTAGIGAPDSVAMRDNDSRTDALFALVLVYNRERRFDQALAALQELRRLYPRNRLLWLEAGSTALRGGRAELADQLLSDGLGRLAKEQRARIPGEEALWRYKRGAARAGLGRTDAALTDLQSASSPDSQPWVHGRARVEIGRLALKRGDRGAAAGEARQAEALCERGHDPACVQEARELLRSSNGR